MPIAMPISVGWYFGHLLYITGVEPLGRVVQVPEVDVSDLLQVEMRMKCEKSTPSPSITTTSVATNGECWPLLIPRLVGQEEKRRRGLHVGKVVVVVVATFKCQKWEGTPKMSKMFGISTKPPIVQCAILACALVMCKRVCQKSLRKGSCSKKKCAVWKRSVFQVFFFSPRKKNKIKH